jgi:hypothetical protein
VVTLAERWIGTAWSVQETPNPTGTKESYLNAVSCTSATVCEAVGFYHNSSGTVVTLGETWNGTAWSVQETPNPTGAKESTLFGVSCTSSTACTAVGYYVNSSGSVVTLAERWNGTAWSVQETPNPSGAKESRTYGVSCASAMACTAVGYYVNSSGTILPLAEAWNGTAWSVQEPPGPSGANEGRTYGVSCTSSTACAAAGYYTNSAGTVLTLAEEYGG